MKYDFLSILDRSGKDCLAVDFKGYPDFGPGRPKDGYSVIPMWVADMNFRTCPAITDAVIARTKEGHFGYYIPSDAYFDSILRWQTVRNGYTGLTKEMIGYENGVLGGVVSAVRAFTLPGENILVHSPTYIGFTHAVEDNGRNLILSDLILDEDGIWRMDYEDMEQKIRKYNIHLAIFCSPHNPTGRVWTKEEIEQAIEVYTRNHCIVISDEIWSDLLLDSSRHVPTLMSCEKAKDCTIAFYAPSKTFSLAGLIGSYHIAMNPYLNDRLVSSGERTHYNSMNVLSMHALIGAYTKAGEEWVEELRTVLSENIHYACDYIREHFPGVTFSVPQGTYMLYIDCEGWCTQTQMSMDELLKKGWDVGVAWQDGRPFHRPYAIRLNLALPKALVVEAFERMNTFVFCPCGK